MQTIHSKIKNIRTFVGTVRSSVKRKDHFEAVQKNINVDCECPILDCKMRWFSTFTMVCKTNNGIFVFSAMEGRAPEMARYNISEAEWKAAPKVCQFSEPAAFSTEVRSKTTFTTLSVIKKIYDKLLTECENTLAVNNVVMKEAAILMRDKLLEYESRVKTSFSHLSRIMNSMFIVTMPCRTPRL